MPIGVYERTEITRRILSESHKGNHHSEETKKKISGSLKGKYVGENSWVYGTHCDEETRRRISESIKGTKRSKETRQKISQALEKRFAQMTKKGRLNYMLPATKAAQTLESRQKASMALRENWNRMTKEEKKNRTKLWGEAGQKACHSSKAIQKMAKTKKKDFANMTKEERRERVMPWILAGQANPSSIEKLIWNELDKLNIEYKIQIPFAGGRFIVDIYIPAQRLIIECNGDYWHNYKIFLESKIRDEALEKYLNKKGYKIIWLWEHDIRKNPKQALQNKFKLKQEISRTIRERKVLRQ